VINVHNAGDFPNLVALTEQGSLGGEDLWTMSLPAATTGSRIVRFDLATRFDNADATVATTDQVLVYMVNPTQPTQTLLDRGAAGTTVFALLDDRAELVPGLVRYDGRTVEIETASLGNVTQIGLMFQLIDGDGAMRSRMVARNFAAGVSASESPAPVFDLPVATTPPGPSIDVSTLQSSTDVTLRFSNPRYNLTSGQHHIDLQASGTDSGLGRNVVVAFPGLPAGGALTNATGATIAGAPYINFRPAIPSGGLDQGTFS
jgi:hypothetical protein